MTTSIKATFAAGCVGAALLANPVMAAGDIAHCNEKFAQARMEVHRSITDGDDQTAALNILSDGLGLCKWGHYELADAKIGAAMGTVKRVPVNMPQVARSK